MAGKFFGIPFAATGDRSATPNAVQPDGSVSYSEGFGFDYERANTDPAYKPVPRDGINGLYYDITDALGIVQKQGFADWTTEAQPYAINSTVRHNDTNWSSEISTNNDEPGVGPGATSWRNIAVPASTPLPLGYFSGFTLANDGGAPNTTISVGAGVARDSTNANNIELTSALRGILQSSGAWAAGENQNKLDTGARANNTWYSVFAIRKTSDGTADILFSLSATAPTMPSGYAGFCRISSVRTDASGNILGFINVENRFIWKTPIIDMNTAPITVRAPYVMKVPTGVRVLAKIGIQGLGGDYAYWIAETDGGAIPASMYYGVLTNQLDDRGGQAHEVITNTSAQVLLETGASVTVFNVSVLGWTELRG